MARTFVIKVQYSPKNLVGCAAAAQNPYPIYDQNLWFSLPFLSPDQIFDTLFMTIAADTVALNIIFYRLLFMVLSIGATHTQFKTRVLVLNWVCSLEKSTFSSLSIRPSTKARYKIMFRATEPSATVMNKVLVRL